jgi:hypothetical protein
VASGQYTAIGSYANSGSRNFTTPSANSYGDWDWLLVLESAGTGAEAPGTAATRTASIQKDAFHMMVSTGETLQLPRGSTAIFDVRGKSIRPAGDFPGAAKLPVGIYIVKLR